ncbi:hypothetical protein CDA39_02350, partial [Klebsiella pneumoniae]
RGLDGGGRGGAESGGGAPRGGGGAGHIFFSPFFPPAPPAVLACRKQRDGKTLQQWQGGWQSGSAFASYLHVHFAQRPTMLNHWLQAARRAL